MVDSANRNPLEVIFTELVINVQNEGTPVVIFR